VDDVANGTAVEPGCMHRSPNEELLAVGDETGMFKIYNYPCVSKQVPVFILLFTILCTYLINTVCIIEHASA